VAPTLVICDSPVSVELIYFGSLKFTPHSTAWRLAFNSLHEQMDLTFGDLSFHINLVGTLRPPDPIHSAPAESTLPSTIVVLSLPSSIGSSSNPKLTPTSISYVDCNAYHVDGGSNDHESCNSSTYRHTFNMWSSTPSSESMLGITKQPTKPPSKSL
jgi:hypothetical protein